MRSNLTRVLDNTQFKIFLRLVFDISGIFDNHRFTPLRLYKHYEDVSINLDDMWDIKAWSSSSYRLQR